MRLLATKGCGSAIIELVFAVAGIGYVREEHDFASAEGKRALLPYNPLAQVPTLILPDGAVMTETAAIALYIDELVPQAELAPARGDPLRRELLRWLTFIVAAVYPTFTYGDDPSKWSCGAELARATNAHREALWRHLETVAIGPWFLGERFSMLDLYICVMTHWRPRRAWFAEHCPRLHAIALATDRDPRLAPILVANFG